MTTNFVEMSVEGGRVRNMEQRQRGSFSSVSDGRGYRSRREEILEEEEC
jgi:hypothetical protein